MTFESNAIYHIFNQGNNRQRIFFMERNYHFFLKKMKTHLSPFGDLLCYCLMPNHFHWLFYTNAVASQLITKSGRSTDNSKLQANLNLPKQRLSHSIGILLSSYTRAINKQENRSGSLFRSKTKAKDGWIDQFITVDGKHREMFFRSENDYAAECFEYIHQNPVEAKLVISQKDWPFSSAKAYSENDFEGICNIPLGKKLLNLG